LKVEVDIFMIQWEFAYENDVDHYQLSSERETPYFYNEEKRALVVTVNVSDGELEHSGFNSALPLDLHFRPSKEEIERNLEPDGFYTFPIWDEYYEFDM
jgi:hypothetical protein